MTLATTIAIKVIATQVSSADLADATFPLNYSDSTSMATGTGASQSDLLFTDQRTIAASSTEDLDLSGSLSDAFGNTLAFVKVKAITVKAASANTNNVTVSPASANGFLGPFADASDLLAIPPGGFITLTAPVSGWTVTASTGDLLTIANSGAGTEVVYDVIIIGTSA